ncbi:MAG: hypothetical protein QM296_03360 [Bacillota bacterium]|nr:hypothetical protein [Bacillota bacterium]
MSEGANKRILVFLYGVSRFVEDRRRSLSLIAVYRGFILTRRRFIVVRRCLIVVCVRAVTQGLWQGRIVKEGGQWKNGGHCVLVE